MSDFKITGGKGFGITFENGWYVSVQFGPFNYCDNRDYNMPLNGDFEKRDKEVGRKGCKNAECAVFDPAGEMIDFPGNEHDTVKGWMDVNEVMELLNKVRNY
jgi:hypothetical protein